MPDEKQMNYKKIYEALSKPIENKYLIKYVEDGKEFNGYNAQAAINRLNEVIGFENWETDSEIRKEEQTTGGWIVVMETKITIYKRDIIIASRVGSGGAYAKKIENAYKGARTSAFKNACKYFGIGKELYSQSMDDDIVIEEIETKETTKKIEEFKNKIVKTKSLEQLKSLEESIKEIKDKAEQKEIYKIYNDKKITLMTV